MRAVIRGGAPLAFLKRRPPRPDSRQRDCILLLEIFRRLGKMEGKRRLEEGEEGAGRCSKVLRLTASPGLQPCVLRTLE